MASTKTLEKQTRHKLSSASRVRTNMLSNKAQTLEASRKKKTENCVNEQHKVRKNSASSHTGKTKRPQVARARSFPDNEVLLPKRPRRPKVVITKSTGCENDGTLSCPPVFQRTVKFANIEDVSELTPCRPERPYSASDVEEILSPASNRQLLAPPINRLSISSDSVQTCKIPNIHQKKFKRTDSSRFQKVNPRGKVEKMAQKKTLVPSPPSSKNKNDASAVQLVTASLQDLKLKEVENRQNLERKISTFLQKPILKKGCSSSPVSTSKPHWRRLRAAINGKITSYRNEARDAATPPTSKVYNSLPIHFANRPNSGAQNPCGRLHNWAGCESKEHLHKMQGKYRHASEYEILVNHIREYIQT